MGLRFNISRALFLRIIAFVCLFANSAKGSDCVCQEQSLTAQKVFEEWAADKDQFDDFLFGEHYEPLGNAYWRELDVLNSVKETFVRILGADVFLRFLLQEELVNNQNDRDGLKALLQWGIDHGADVNRAFFDKTVLDYLQAQHYDNKDDTLFLITFMLSQGGKCFKQGPIEWQQFTHFGLEHLIKHPELIVEAKYKNLNAERGLTLRVPQLVHHIWLTHKDQPRELRPQDIEEVIRTKALFEKTSPDWTHIVWTNAIHLIPESVKALEAAGIKVQSIQNHQDSLVNYDFIESMINQKKWGIASDVLRYNLVYHFGGVYADLNFHFHRGVLHELYTYDFFAIAWSEFEIGNCFFAAKPLHPIFEAILRFFSDKNQPAYIEASPVKSANFQAEWVFPPFYLSYYQAAHSNQNCDVAYPSVVKFPPMIYYDPVTKSLALEQACSKTMEFQEFRKQLSEQNYNAMPFHAIGIDSEDGGTWTK